MDQRAAYCRFWQRKLAENKDIDFPDRLCEAIAGITDGFSFAYIQEAFVAALLAIARNSEGSTECPWDATRAEGVDTDWVEVASLGDDDNDGDGDLEGLILWVEIKKQVAILREGMEEKPGALGGPENRV
jgi:hypothetical protein